MGMKAFLLAAGKGTRLRPITDHTPKCLVPIRGKPLLEIWLELLRRHGTEDVLINTHHHAEKVTEFIGHYDHARPRVSLTYEPDLLGSAGTLWRNRDFVKQEKDFLIIYADNLTDVPLDHVIQFHRRHAGALTMALFRSREPKSCGIAEMQPGDVDQGLIIGFQEKPENPKTNLANAGIYVASETIFDHFPQGAATPPHPLDFGYHVLPNLVNRMYGYVIDSFLMDIGTLESYKVAQRTWPYQ